jgi:hypothetical protein
MSSAVSNHSQLALAGTLYSTDFPKTVAYANDLGKQKGRAHHSVRVVVLRNWSARTE